MASTHADVEPAPVGLSPRTYEEVLRNIHDAVYTLDPEGTITWVNEVAVEEFDGGYSREELIGAPVTKILSIEDVERCADLIADLVANDPQGSRRCEIDLVTADGRTIPCDLHLALLPTENGSFAGTLGVVRDITEQKRREQGLSVLNRVLRHNLRNELSIVLAGVDEFGGDEEWRATTIESAVDRLLRTSEKARKVEEMLSRGTVNVEPVDLGAIAAERATTFAERHPELTLDVTAPSGCRIPDDGVLELLIDELLENAVRHHDGDHPEVAITVEAGGDGKARLTVTDDGPGIPAAELEPLDAATESPLVHTSGLGLWLVTWATDRLGGEVSFESAEPRGTRVAVRLPTSPTDAENGH